MAEYKTERCVYGHLYDGFIHTDGKRRCRKCLRRNQREWIAAKRAAIRRVVDRAIFPRPASGA